MNALTNSIVFTQMIAGKSLFCQLSMNKPSATWVNSILKCHLKSGTFLVHQGDDTDAPLWVFSNKRITQISDQTFTTEKEIDYKNIIGFDFDKDYFIIKTTEHIITYDMKTGDISNQWPMFDTDIIWSEK